jgi:hypothetical protein
MTADMDDVVVAYVDGDMVVYKYDDVAVDVALTTSSSW